jgi:hypothetical protein
MNETTIAAHKVQFFYELPELVQLRSEIMHRACEYAIVQKQEHQNEPPPS